MYGYSQLFKVQQQLGSDAVTEERLVIIQCDLGSVSGDLIACARYRIHDLRVKADEEQRTHVLFIIHLTHQVAGSFVGFQGDPWVSYHIDDLNTSTENTVSASEAIGLSLSELFRGPTDPDEGPGEASEEEGGEEAMDLESKCGISYTCVSLLFVLLCWPCKNRNFFSSPVVARAPKRVPMYKRLHSCIQAAASKVKDFTAKRCTKRVEILVNLIPKDYTNELGRFCQ